MQKREQTNQAPVLIISHDIIGNRMAGPGIRYYHLARILAREFPIILAAPDPVQLDPQPEFTTLAYKVGEYRDLSKAIAAARAILVPAVSVVTYPALLGSAKPLIVDGYDPFVAETLAFQAVQCNNGEEDVVYRSLLPGLTQAYLHGDFFICASERQRDWWLGLLEASGRLNYYTFQEDNSLRRLVDVVPFGLPEQKPKHTRQVMRGVWPGLEADTKIILWGGGLWPWLDALTAIRAVAEVWQQRQDVRLVFPGTRHPNPDVARHVPTQVETAKQVAQESGLLNKAIFFGDWVPYEDWPDVVLESDLAITLHYDTLETRLAYRSRVLDYIWAGLPVIASGGDATSELITRYGLGRVVGYEDVEGVSRAILDQLETPREALAGRFENACRDLTWEQAAQPLVEFCRQPRLAQDRVVLGRDIGNLFYTNEINRLRTLLEAYEQGRFIRLMRFLYRIRLKFQQYK